MSQSGQLFGYGMESEDVVVRRVTRRVSRYVVELQAMQEALERARESARPSSATPITAATSLASEPPHFEFADEVPTLVARARGEAPKHSEDTGSSAVPPSVAKDGESQERREQQDKTTASAAEEQGSTAAPVPPVPPPPPVSQVPELEAASEVSPDAASPGTWPSPSAPSSGEQRGGATFEPEDGPKATVPSGPREPPPQPEPVALGPDKSSRSRDSSRGGATSSKGTTTKPKAAAKSAAAPQKLPSPPPLPPAAVPSARLARLSSAPPSSSPALSEWSKEASPSRWSPPVLLALIIGMSIALAGLVYFLLTFNKYVY